MDNLDIERERGITIMSKVTPPDMFSRAMAASVRAESQKLGNARFDDHVWRSVILTARVWLDPRSTQAS